MPSVTPQDVINAEKTKVPYSSWDKKVRDRDDLILLENESSRRRLLLRSSSSGIRKATTENALKRWSRPVNPVPSTLSGRRASMFQSTASIMSSIPNPKGSVMPGKERMSGGRQSSFSKSRKKSSGGTTTSSVRSIDPRQFTFGANPRRDMVGGSHYARAVLMNAHPLVKGPPPENLRYLDNVDHLFFKSCKKFPPEIKDFDPKEKLGVWNSGGRCVYYVGLTKSFIGKHFRSGFTYEVVDYLGRPVLTSTGSQWFFGLRAEVSVKFGDGILLGSMEQEFFSAAYNIKDSQGRVVYTIHGSWYAPGVPCIFWWLREDFEICMDDGISEIGRMSRDWDEELAEFNGDWGIEFELEDDMRVKALLLGVFFLIRYQYYRHGGNGVFYFIVYLILISAIVFLVTNGFGYFPQFNSPLVPGEVFES